MITEINCIDDIKRELICMDEIRKKVVRPFPKIEMMQYETYNPKWKLMLNKKGVLSISSCTR